jgi:hypothetical protein
MWTWVNILLPILLVISAVSLFQFFRAKKYGAGPASNP